MTKSKFKSQQITTKHTKTVSEDFNVRKKKYEEMKELRSILKEKKTKFSEEQKRRRNQIEENRERKAQNELNHGSFQVIKNPEKIKKWKTKARGLIRNVPKDIFYKKFYNKES